MKRFIEADELARDSRFKRAKSGNTLIRNLPDDVDEIVRVFEAIGPKIKERVVGTGLETIYDELGPGFSFLMNTGEVKKGAPGEDIQLKLRLHGIFVGEVQALEAAGRTLCDFPEWAWELSSTLTSAMSKPSLAMLPMINGAVSG